MALMYRSLGGTAGKSNKKYGNKEIKRPSIKSREGRSAVKPNRRLKVSIVGAFHRELHRIQVEPATKCWVYV